MHIETVFWQLLLLAEDLDELEIHVCSFHLGGRTHLICNNEGIMHDRIVGDLVSIVQVVEFDHLRTTPATCLSWFSLYRASVDHIEYRFKALCHQTTLYKIKNTQKGITFIKWD